MAFQLIYTSVRRGLIPGRSGYTVAARHRQIRERLVSEIERISGYTFSKSGESPVIYAHRKLSVSGAQFHILTRNVDAGSDYTGRTNHLAHHLICEASEIANCRSSPAEVLHGFQWSDRYEEDPRYFDDSEVVDLDAYANSFPLPATNWETLRGEAADAALLFDDKGKPTGSVVAARSGSDADQRQLLALFGESAQLSGIAAGKANPWAVSFTTYFQAVDNLADFDWAGCTSDSPAFQRPGRRLVLDLAHLSQPTPSGALAKRAETGSAPAPPPAPTSAQVQAPDAALRAAPKPPPPTAVAAQSQKAPMAGAAPTPGPMPSTKLRAPSVAKSPAPVGAPRAQIAEPDDGGSFWSENWRVLSIVAAVVLVAGGLLFHYVGNVQPWQSLRNDVDVHLGRGDFERANGALDQAAAKRSGWRERIRELRSGKVFDGMVADAEACLEEISAAVDPRIARMQSNRASTKLRKLQSFVSSYEIADAGRVTNALEAQLRQLQSRIPREAEVVKIPPKEDPDHPDDPPVDPPDPEPKDPVTPPEPAALGPRMVYLFLNQGLDSVALPQSLPDLASGERGAKMVTLHPQAVAMNRFPPMPDERAQGFDYKFPETAAEEDNPILPRGGGVNVELKFQGGSALYLVKNDSAGGGSGSDVWARTSSRAFSFDGARERFQIVLWDGRPFKPVEIPFEPDGNKVIVSPQLARFLAAINRGQPLAAAPRSVVIRYVPPASDVEVQQPLESDRLPVPIENPSDFEIDFGAVAARRELALADFDKKIELRRRAIEDAGDYFEWRGKMEPLETGLRSIATQVLGKDPDVLIRFRSILDHADSRRVRKDLRDYVTDVLNHFMKKLEDLDIPKGDYSRVDGEVSGAQFWDRWGRREIDSSTAEEFASFMERFSDEMRSLGKRHVRLGLGEIETSFYRIDSRTARAELLALADAWETQFLEEAGVALWEFISQTRPAVPTNLKLIERYQREIPGLMTKRAEAERSLAGEMPMVDGELPPGRYEVCLEFPDGKLWPLVTATVSPQPTEE